VITDLRVFTRHPAAAWRRVGGEMVLLQPEREQLLGVNPSAAAIWDALDGARTVSAIAEQLAAAAGIDLARAQRDVAAFLAELERRQLIAQVVV
jgi:hypothetical protein